MTQQGNSHVQIHRDVSMPERALCDSFEHALCTAEHGSHCSNLQSSALCRMARRVTLCAPCMLCSIL